MKNQVNNIINNYLKSQIEEFKSIKESTIEFEKGLKELIGDTKEMNNQMSNLNVQVKKYKDEKHIIKFKEKIIKREETIKKCNYIAIENINIVNIGNKILWNLYFVKDEKESSEDFIFCDTNKKKDNLYLLNGNGFFPPNQEIMHSVGLKIKNPKSNNSYKLILYVREKENGPNLSEPLQIIINVKEDKEDKEDKINKEEQLFNELNNKYNFIAIKKEEVLAKIKEANCNKVDIIKWIQEKIDQEVNKLYEELNKDNDLPSIADKAEVIAKIKELHCNKEEMIKWIKEQIQKNYKKY